MERREVIYRGRVQGVGFRFTARQTAQKFAVTGTVRNLPDGSVEVIAEGTAEELDAFLEALGRRMADYIRDCRVHRMAATGAFDAFEIIA